MIILLDTSTPLCKLRLINDQLDQSVEWQADRQLAHGLLRFIDGELKKQGQTWQDVTGIGVFQGPGSFTGLRIGLTVMNTLANALGVPIVGALGQAWQDQALARLSGGENDQLVLPEYGSEAHITKPRK